VYILIKSNAILLQEIEDFSKLPGMSHHHFNRFQLAEELLLPFAQVGADGEPVPTLHCERE